MVIRVCVVTYLLGRCSVGSLLGLVNMKVLRLSLKAVMYQFVRVLRAFGHMYNSSW